MGDYNLVPVELKEFSKGATHPIGDCGNFVSGIDHNITITNLYQWDHQIEVYGSTPEQAEALRDRVLGALEAPDVQGEPVIRKLGIMGAAFDLPSVRRAYTYSDQPNNTTAWKLGSAACKERSGGDFIDYGLQMLRYLQDEGFGVFEIDEAAPAPQPTEQQPLPCQECGGDGAGGEHEEDCAMAKSEPHTANNRRRTMTSWISVDDQMPELDQDIVVANHENYYAGKFCNRPGFDRCIMNGKWFRGFTHWMPLPEPPEVLDAGGEA